MNCIRLLLIVAVVLSAGSVHAGEKPKPLPGTKPLTIEGDITSQLVDGVDRFLLGELEKSIARRGKLWNRDRNSPPQSDKPIRKRLAHMLGVRDARVLAIPPGG